MRIFRCGIAVAVAVAAATFCLATHAKAATYTDPESAFTIRYPRTAQIVRQDFSQYLPLTQSGVIGFTLDGAPFSGTNLASAGVYIGIGVGPVAIEACVSAAASRGEKPAGGATIHGVNFAVMTRDEGAAGNFYHSKIYRAVHGGSCYELVELTHSHNIGAYPPGTVRPFDDKAVTAKLDAIVKSFAFGK